MSFRFMLVLAIALLASSFAGAQQQPMAFHCAQDADIDAMKRAVIESAATNFIHTVLSDDPGSAWDTMTDQGRHSVTRNQFVTTAMLAIAPTQPHNLTPQHTFLIHVVGTVPPNARVTCGTDVTNPMDSYKMAVIPAPEQAYTLITADGAREGLVFTLWLVRNEAGWAVNSFAFNVATLAGRDAPHLWQLARVQHQRGHEFNATLLYFAASQIANRGPSFELGYASQIPAEQAKIARPKEITGPIPFLFDPEGQSFTVQNIGASEAGGRLFLAVTQEVGPGHSAKQLDQRNRELISFIKKHFPEYTDVFDGILVQAADRTSARTFATVDESNVSRP